MNEVKSIAYEVAHDTFVTEGNVLLKISRVGEIVGTFVWTTPIMSIAVNELSVALIGEDKSICLVSRVDMTSTFNALKKSNDIVFGNDGCLLIADKFGDVYSYKTKDCITSEPRLILGHVSMTTSLLLTTATSTTPSMLLTCERDEKIKVSHYPHAYVIEHFLFGHTKLISSMAQNGSIVYSCGGDDFILVSDFTTGKELARVKLDTDSVVVNSKTDFAEHLEPVARVIMGKAHLAVVFEECATVFVYSVKDAQLPVVVSRLECAEGVTDVCFLDNDDLVIAAQSAILYSTFTAGIYGEPDKTHAFVTAINSAKSMSTMALTDIAPFGKLAKNYIKASVELKKIALNEARLKKKAEKKILQEELAVKQAKNIKRKAEEAEAEKTLKTTKTE